MGFKLLVRQKQLKSSPGSSRTLYRLNEYYNIIRKPMWCSHTRFFFHTGCRHTAFGYLVDMNNVSLMWQKYTKTKCIQIWESCIYIILHLQCNRLYSAHQYSSTISAFYRYKFDDWKLKLCSAMKYMTEKFHSPSQFYKNIILSV